MLIRWYGAAPSFLRKILGFPEESPTNIYGMTVLSSQHFSSGPLIRIIGCSYIFVRSHSCSLVGVPRTLEVLMYYFRACRTLLSQEAKENLRRKTQRSTEWPLNTDTNTRPQKPVSSHPAPPSGISMPTITRNC